MGKKIIVYTMRRCTFCEMAKRLLEKKGLPFEERLVELSDDETWNRLERENGYKTMPQIYVGEHFVGGYMQLAELEREGELDELVLVSD